MKYGNYKVIKKLTGNITDWSELCINNTQLTQGGFMNEQQNMEDRLWDFIDGFSTTDEKSAIEKFVKSNFEWQRKYHELLEVHQLMNSTELDAPSLRFSKNVMEEIT